MNKKELILRQILPMEKALVKIEKALYSWNKEAGNCFRVVEVDRNWYAKALVLRNKIEDKYSKTMSEAWDDGIFV
jgi:hypothetical protein